MKKVIILGGSGMAGHMIKAYFEENNYDVYWTNINQSNSSKEFEYDIMKNMEYLESIVKKIKPDLVINAVGILNKSAEDDHVLAIKVNTLFPHYVAKLAHQYKFKMIHMSTDCVFSGKKGNYSETDMPDATSMYGRSKSLGEVYDENILTLRTSIIGPDPNKNGIGLFHWFMNQTGNVNGYTNAIWSGVTTLELAKGMKKAYEENLNGLYQFVNNKTIDKYSLLNLFQKTMNKNDVTIIPFDQFSENKSLINTRKDFDYEIPSYETMVEEMGEWIKKHSDMYSYEIKNVGGSNE